LLVSAYVSNIYLNYIGITRNPTGGQSKDIYQQIVDLIKRYIEPKTAIVLHVIPSSVDFTTSESIQISKKYDRNGKNGQTV
jgi:predicted transcriptional regulator YheO